MSRKTYISLIVLCVCLIFLVILLVRQPSDIPMNETIQIPYGKNVATESHEKESVSQGGEKTHPAHEAPMSQGHGDTEKPNASEQWILPFEEGDTTIDQRRFSHIFWTLYGEYELYVLAKYADWTEEQRKQRFWALQGTGDRSEAVQLEESELMALSGARGRAQSRITPPSSWEEADNLLHRVSIYTKDTSTLGRIRWKPQLTDENREAMNQIIERLNQAISSNKAILTYWDDLIEGWDLPPMWEESEDGHWELRKWQRQPRQY